MACLVWAHDLHSSVEHEDALGRFDWTSVREVASVVRYDARGHGDAEAQYEDRAYRWSALVDDMLWAADEGPFVAGGVGMGAVTALFAALRAPRRVQGLVLALPPPAWEARTRAAEELLEAAGELEKGGLAAYERWLAVRPGGGAVLGQHLHQMEPKALLASLRGAAASDLPTREEVRGIVVPTLILACEDIPGAPVETALALAELLVLSELHVGPAPGVMVSWPALMRRFVSELPQWDAA
jgi:3-oxoadipate enol-lactonase